MLTVKTKASAYPPKGLMIKRKKKYKKIKNRKQMTRIKIERLHLHHYFAIASHVDTPILEL